MRTASGRVATRAASSEVKQRDSSSRTSSRASARARGSESTQATRSTSGTSGTASRAQSRPQKPIPTCTIRKASSVSRVNGVLVQLPPVGRIRRDQPLTAGTCHHVEVIEVIPRTGGNRMVAAGHENHVAVADLNCLIEGAIVGVDKLHGEALRACRAVVIGLFQVGLAGRIVRVVLVRWVAGPIPGGSQDFRNQQR